MWYAVAATIISRLHGASEEDDLRAHEKETLRTYGHARKQRRFVFQRGESEPINDHPITRILRDCLRGLRNG